MYRKKNIYIGFGTIRNFRHPRRGLGTYPPVQRGTTVLQIYPAEQKISHNITLYLFMCYKYFILLETTQSSQNITGNGSPTRPNWQSTLFRKGLTHLVQINQLINYSTVSAPKHWRLKQGRKWNESKRELYHVASFLH